MSSSRSSTAITTTTTATTSINPALLERQRVLTTNDAMIVSAGIKSETVAALRIALSLAGLPKHERRIVDLRPTSAFALTHLRHSIHIPQGPDGLLSRFSSLPPRHIPFTVVCEQQHESWVRNHLGGLRRRVQGVVLCSNVDPVSLPERPDAGLERNLHFTASASEKEFWKIAQTLALTTEGGTEPAARLVDSFDRPKLLGQPAPVVRRAASYMSTLHCHSRRTHDLTVLDLGCGAARDIAWLCYEHAWRSPTQACGINWIAVGADNLRPVLDRAKVVLDDFGLLTFSERRTGGGQYGRIAKMVWSEVRRDGSMGALTGPGRGPRGATRLDAGPSGSTPSATPLINSWIPQAPEKMHQQRYDLQRFAQQHLDPHHSSDGNPVLTTTDSKPVTFDLLLFVRFLPRQLLLTLPALSHPGSVVVISHFYDLGNDPRWPLVQDGEEQELSVTDTLQPVTVHHRPRTEYEGPPPQARIAPGDMEHLLTVWNEVPLDDRKTETKQKWILVELVVEPIEDGRPVLSTILRRIR